MFYVYILKSESSSKHYIGSSSDLARRLADHNRGKVIATRNKGPWIIVYSEEFFSRNEAVKREYQIKTYKGGNAFKALFEVVPLRRDLSDKI